MPVKTYRVKTGLALSTGCALLAILQRAEADVFSETEVDTPNRHLVYLDPSRVLPKFGTLGAGVEYRMSLSQTMGLRLEQFTREDQRVVSKDAYSYKVYGRLQSSTIALDWHPFSGIFRTSAGMIVNNLDLGARGATNGGAPYDIHVSPADVANFLAKPEVQQYLAANAQQLAEHNIDINAAVSQFNGLSGSGNVDYSGAISASAKVTWNKFAPYLGFGWTNLAQRKSGFLYSLDIGAMYVGRPKVELSVNGPIADEMNRYYGAEFQRYIDGERQATEEKLSHYRVLPVVSLGLSYRF